MLDKYSDLLFTLTPHDSFIGFGNINNKVVLFYTELDEVIPANPCIIKIIDFILYKKAINLVFENNPLANTLYVNRFEKGTEDCLTLSRDEFILLNKEF